MNIEFGNSALEELYTTGATKDHEYKRLSRDIVKGYVKVVNYLRMARRIEDLYSRYCSKRSIIKNFKTL